VDEAVRRMVRAAAGQGRLTELVAELRASRPLLEWPEPTTSACERAPAPSPEPPSQPSEPAADGAELDGDSAPAAASASAEPPETEPPETEPPVAESPAEDPPAAEPPFDPGEPLIDPFFRPEDPEPEAEEASRAAWWRQRRWWLGLAVATAVVATVGLGGFLAGRSGSRPAPTGEAEPAEAPEGAGDAPAELAPLAAAELARATSGVLEICGSAPGQGSPREELAHAFRLCRAHAALPWSARRTLPPAALGPSQTAAAEPPPARPERQRTAAPSAMHRCLERCDRAQKRCHAEQCGPEPTRGSDYPRYQRCLSECLRQASACRLRCP